MKKPRKKAGPSARALRGVLNKMAEVHATRFLAYQTDLRDAVAFIDRLQQNKGDWTVADVLRLAEIRQLAGKP